MQEYHEIQATKEWIHNFIIHYNILLVFQLKKHPNKISTLHFKKTYSVVFCLGKQSTTYFMLYFVVGCKVQHTTVTNVNDPLSITCPLVRGNALSHSQQQGNYRALARDLLAKSIKS